MLGVRDKVDIRETVKQILGKHGLYQIPVNVVELAKREGFAVLQQALEGFSGAILVNTDNKFKIDNKEYNKVILIDNYQSNVRKNFTVAHELGHYFLEFDGKGKIFAHRENNANYTPCEVRANNFASELLMPQELLDNFIKEIINKYPNYNWIAAAIASAFNVSQAAAEFRLDKYLRGV